MQLQLIKDDPSLYPYESALNYRYSHFKNIYSHITNQYGSLKNFAAGHLYFGIHEERVDNQIKGWWYREWAPSAIQLYILGDFNNWNRNSHPLVKKHNGVWEIFFPYDQFKNSFTHRSRIKVRVISRIGDNDRIPLYAKRVIQNAETHDFSAEIWIPNNQFQWTDQNFSFHGDTAPKIYEAHIGMSEERLGIATYKEFIHNTLPRIKKAGYNVIQLMAIQEHPYYASFGYHVSNFFAASSRYGTPDELKELINTAHSMGIAVIMDIVHSHSVKNTREGINEFDGTGFQFFHDGGRGDHWLWDSKLFDYGKMDVTHFLLSNVRFWVEEYHFDGFRFDGVTSMMYLHHGLGRAFVHYDCYFYDIDTDAITYLQLANTLLKEIKPNSISIAEDVSGMPGLCRPIEDGGIGFDYRLAMGLPDFWIKLLKEKTDEQWDILEIWGALTNRRHNEKHIAYAESHDQAIVGDKTISMWLMNADLYYWMKIWDQNFIIDRGIALHKMIRFITILLGGEGYLNFIGNEFGHPDWIDFPREGNGWSYWYARRQWSLVDNPDLKYKYMALFDQKMIQLVDNYNLLKTYPRQLNMDLGSKLMMFEKGGLIFIFNFNPHQSFADYRFGVPMPGKYQIILNSDAAEFGGYGRIDENTAFFTQPEPYHGQPQSLQVYAPQRTAFVLKKID